MTMTMKTWSSLIGVAMLTLTLGCARQTPLAPEDLGSAISDARVELATTGGPVVTLMPDLTANPAEVTVPVGGSVLFSNQTAGYVLMRSSNCSEFSIVGLQAGVSRHTFPFYPGGRTCNYYAYKYPQKVFVGRVYVQ